MEEQAHKTNLTTVCPEWSIELPKPPPPSIFAGPTLHSPFFTRQPAILPLFQFNYSLRPKKNVILEILGQIIKEVKW
jgi:hypothetical protein